MEPLTTSQKRDQLLEIMVKTHRITTDLANWHIGRMSEADVDERLEMYRKQGNGA